MDGGFRKVVRTLKTRPGYDSITKFSKLNSVHDVINIRECKICVFRLLDHRMSVSN